MLGENKILREGIKLFRILLNEGVGEQNIIDAIQNHEYLYIYYDGDDANKMGYRTIRPFVLGTSKSGDYLLRAWQDNPKNSFHFTNRPTRKDSYQHDYWSDEQGAKPGWRMFRLDKISKAYPTGKKFHDENNLVMIPAGYHEGGDKNMTSIVAYVSSKKEPEFDYSYDKEFRGQELSKPEQRKQKWDSIRRGNKANRKITVDDVKKLSDIASRVFKKNRNNFFVVIDDRNNFQLIDIKDKDRERIPDTAIVGALPNLYNSLVNTAASTDKSFFNNILNKTKAELNITNAGTEKTGNVQPEPGERKIDNKAKGMDFQSTSMMKENDLPTIPFEKKTFFKQ